MAPTLTPNPTCIGFTPPSTALGRLAARKVCAIRSWKCTRLLLNPVVLIFAMLLPMTFIFCWCAFRLATPESIACHIALPP